jgi:hypothetical protein
VTEENSAAENSISPSRAVANAWWKERLRKGWWRAHYLLPNVIPCPYRRDQAYYEKRDAERNPLTRLPEGEKLRVLGLWATEVYGPLEIEALYANLKRLEWDRAATSSNRPGAVQWIHDSRMFGSIGNFNIGIVTRRNQQLFHGIENFAALPEEVEYLRVYAYQLSPSLTCVQVGFILSEAAECAYDNALATDRRSKQVTDSKRRRVSIYGVEHLKGQAVDDARARYREIATNWMRNELPGFFTNSTADNLLPTAEFVVTECSMLLDFAQRSADEEQSVWQRLVWNRAFHEEWTSENFSDMQLALDGFDDEARYHSVVALRTRGLPTEQLDPFGGNSREGLAALCQNEVSGVLVCIAGLAFLREGERIVKLTRERLRTKKDGENIVEVLDHIKDYFTDSIGQPAVARELLKGADKVGFYKYWCEEFTRKDWPQRGKTYSLREILRSNTKELATRFLEDEAASREQFEQLSSILNTKESIKAQQRMERLTVIALVVAFGSFLAALPALYAVLPDDWQAGLIELRGGGAKNRSIGF